MIRIGITGKNGFVGSHLYNTIALNPDKYILIDFQNDFFENPTILDSFVQQCDVIVHLAAMNRHPDPIVIYDTNLELVQKLKSSLERTGSKAHVLFSSSSQEEKDNLYGKSKKEGRKLLEEWASHNGGKFTGLIIPNVFGPFGKPFYNSFIATFCHQLTHGEDPKIEKDGMVNLIYVGELVNEILKIIDTGSNEFVHDVTFTKSVSVSEVLKTLQYFKKSYFENGEVPALKSTFDYQLFNTFRCYIDAKEFFPIRLKNNVDNRGNFVEIIRLGIGGQCSFSTTNPGITRGNHFHTRKIERFAVINGSALIQLRKVGTHEILDFYLNGNEPSYVDMPIWYTHNIKNIGDEELYTIFWINEPYNPEDADTFFEEV